jgi:isoquinoline 1-oxidoreductase
MSIENSPFDVERGTVTSALDWPAQLSRRDFVKSLGAGLLLVATVPALGAQGRGRREQAPATIDTRLHIAEDGTITVMTGKVEMGQGARAQLTQAAAEELHLPPEQIHLIMGDTSLCPDDGGTWGSQTTPRTVPSVRAACAAAYGLLAQLRADRGNEKLSWADLGRDASSLKRDVPRDVQVSRVEEWKVLGSSLARPNAREIVTGAHQFPSDVIRPGMLYAKVLRPPSYGATLQSIDLSAAKAVEGAQVMQDGNFVAVAAPSTHKAKRAIEALAQTAKWQEAGEHVASEQLFDHLRKTAQGAPEPDEAAAASAAHVLRASYEVAYVQHVPMEPRAGVAEPGADGKMTVWTGSQNPFGVRRDVARVTGLAEQDVHVLTPDFGGGFGGKGSGEAGVEAARIARAIGKPVALRWTREEEFTWAYFRPATVMNVQATLDDSGQISSWHFVNINAGGSGVRSPYRAAIKVDEAVRASGPLREGSYRALGSTANNFARECAMDELAEAAKQDPLAFRLAHLEEGRLRAVLEEAARHFGWEQRRKQPREPGVGIGIACGEEKGSFVAACAEVVVDVRTGAIRVLRICESFECGKVQNPKNCTRQVEGAIVQGLGPLFREAMQFAGGRIGNPSLLQYEVPRFADLPGQIEIHLVDRPDLPSVGAGETPLMPVAPAIANAVYDAVGQRLRSMPLRLKTN